MRAKGWVCVSTRRPNRFQLGSVERWLRTVDIRIVYELSATVIHLVARHAFAADISVRVCGKKLSPRRDKKNPNATSDEFSRLENFSLIGDTRGGRDIGMKKGGKKK